MKIKLHLLVCISLNLCLVFSKVNSQPMLWGTTLNSGNDKVGTIFSSPTGTNTILPQYEFKLNVGSRPAYTKLIQGPNGKLYGVTSAGGNGNVFSPGVLFSYDIQTNQYTKLINFRDSSIQTGYQPNGSLLLASNGRMYGMTRLGGPSFQHTGSIFEYDPSTNLCIDKIYFNGLNGDKPYGSLIEVSPGKLYGMTYGGVGGNGLIFEYDFNTNTVNVKKNLNSPNGYFPYGDLFKASDGLLYGLTEGGGNGSSGTFFSYSPTTNVLATIKHFGAFSIPLYIDGKRPYGSIIEYNGKLYGNAREGGANGSGTIFTYTLSSGVFSKIVDMDASLGQFPVGSLCVAPNNKLYGMTPSGGAYGNGTIIELDPITNVCTNLYDFDIFTGSNAMGSLMVANNGKLYGLTSYGGSTGSSGTLFEFDINTSTFSKKIDLNSHPDGYIPCTKLVNDSNVRLFGTTTHGGAYDAGVIFEYDLTNYTYSKRQDFNPINGARPLAEMIRTANGKLFGMTNLGGVFNMGVIYEYDIASSSFTKKFDLSVSNGGKPYGGLVEHPNGKLYGLTSEGGIYNSGVLFEFDPVTNTYAKKYEFDNALMGTPRGSLCCASDGNLYGLCSYDTTIGAGGFFKYDVQNDTLEVKQFFTINVYTLHSGTPVEATNGKLYGVYFGQIYEYDLVSAQFNFLTSGASSVAKMLLLASNNKFYGLSNSIFEFDYVSNIVNTLGYCGNYGQAHLYNFFALSETNYPCPSPSQPIILSSSDSICQGDSVELSVTSGSLNGAARWAWYDGSCGGNYQGSGTTITDFPVTNTNYFVRAEGGCVLQTGNCDSLPITVNATPLAGFTFNNNGLTYSFSDTSSGPATSWHWDFGDGSVDSIQNPVHTYATTGNYTVTLTVGSGNCTSSTSFNLLILSAKDISLSDGTLIKLYPNPVSGRCTLTFSSNSKTARAEVVNTLGEKMLSKTFSSENDRNFKVDIDCSGFVSGMYFISVITDTDRANIPFSKE